MSVSRSCGSLVLVLSMAVSVACDDSTPPVGSDSGGGVNDVDASQAMAVACDFPVSMPMSIDEDGNHYGAAICNPTEAATCEVRPDDSCSGFALYFSIFLVGDERQLEFAPYGFAITSNSSGTVNTSSGRLQGFEEGTDVTLTITNNVSDDVYDLVFRYDGEQVTISTFAPAA